MKYIRLASANRAGIKLAGANLLFSTTTIISYPCQVVKYRNCYISVTILLQKYYGTKSPSAPYITMLRCTSRPCIQYTYLTSWKSCNATSWTSWNSVEAPRLYATSCKLETLYELELRKIKSTDFWPAASCDVR